MMTNNNELNNGKLKLDIRRLFRGIIYNDIMYFCLTKEDLDNRWIISNYWQEEVREVAMTV